MNRTEVIAECRERRGKREISDQCARTIMQLHMASSPTVIVYLANGILPPDDTDASGRVTINGETKLWRILFASYDRMPKDDRLMGDMLGTYLTHATLARLTPRCATMGCSNISTHVLTYTFPESRNHTETDRVCEECGQGYMRRPTLKASMEPSTDRG